MRTVGNVQFVSISEAKSNLPKLAEATKPTVLLRRNEPVAALVSIEKYNDYLALEKVDSESRILRSTEGEGATRTRNAFEDAAHAR